MRFAILLMIFTFITVIHYGQRGDLIVSVTGAENNEGNIKVALYNEAGSSGFLKNIESAYDKNSSKIHNGKAEVVFTNIPYGTYAVSVFHDENDNGELETAPLGFPTEPYGVSGDKGFKGIPTFKNSKFVFNSNKTITIQLKRFSLN